MTNQRHYMDNIATKLRIFYEICIQSSSQVDIKDFNDWYNVTQKAISEIGGHALLNKYRSMPKLLLSIYPEYLLSPV